MPYIEDIKELEDENQLEWDLDWDQKIWRYLDMEQFLSVMHRSALRFSRADQFADEFEGSVPSAESMPKNLDTILRRAPEITNISCWHKAPSESMTMWEIYSDRGVVIESTPQQLRDSFCDKRKFSVQFADVQYLNYKSDTFEFFERTGDGNIRGSYTEPFQFKREYYEGEKEFRAITGPLASEEFRSRTKSDDADKSKWSEIVDQNKTSGIFITVDLNELISNITMSPSSSIRDYQVVKKLAERKHGLGHLVKESDINTDVMVTTYRRK